jgi:hypothetical protein
MQKLNQIIEENLQEARARNGGMDGNKSGKSALNIATLRSGKKNKKKGKKETISELFGGV